MSEQTRSPTIVLVLTTMPDNERAAQLAEVLVEAGQEIPPPSRPDTEYSGKFIIRAPRSLHRQLAKSATAYAVEVERQFRGLPRLAQTREVA